MGCNENKIGNVRTLSLLEIQLAVEKLEKCCGEVPTDGMIPSVDQTPVVTDIALNTVTKEWELVFGDGTTKAYRKADTDLNGDIIEVEV